MIDVQLELLCWEEAEVEDILLGGVEVERNYMDICHDSENDTSAAGGLSEEKTINV